MENHNDIEKVNKKLINIIINKSDSIVAISGLFANVGVFGITLRKMSPALPPVIYSDPSAVTQIPVETVNYLGNGIYIGLILFTLIIAYGLWKFRSWGWLITVVFSVACILLVIPDILNYHAALVSMILLSYITQPAVREKYMNLQ